MDKKFTESDTASTEEKMSGGDEDNFAPVFFLFPAAGPTSVQFPGLMLHRMLLHSFYSVDYSLLQ